MTIRLSDLSPKARAQAEATAGVPVRAGKRASHAGVGDADPCPYRCGCGETFESYTQADRHLVDEHSGSGRLEVVL